MPKIFKPAVKSKKVVEISENGCKQKVAEKSLNQRLKVKKFWKIWIPAVTSKKVAEKSEKQRLKSKKLLKNLKTVESKKVAEKSLKQWFKAKSCWKIWKPAVESKKVAKKSENVIHEKLYFIC